jgi:hypothetical protein
VEIPDAILTPADWKRGYQPRLFPPGERG